MNRCQFQGHPGRQAVPLGLRRVQLLREALNRLKFLEWQRNTFCAKGEVLGKGRNRHWLADTPARTQLESDPPRPSLALSPVEKLWKLNFGQRYGSASILAAQL
jgi:hypothetical protein